MVVLKLVSRCPNTTTTEAKKKSGFTKLKLLVSGDPGRPSGRKQSSFPCCLSVVFSHVFYCVFFVLFTQVHIRTEDRVFFKKKKTPTNSKQSTNVLGLSSDAKKISHDLLS